MKFLNPVTKGYYAGLLAMAGISLGIHTDLKALAVGFVVCAAILYFNALGDYGDATKERK